VPPNLLAEIVNLAARPDPAAGQR